MSQIGSNIASSVVGGLAGQQRAGEARRATDSSTAQRGSFSEQLTEEINSDDLDSQVNADAEGRGSQGRNNSEGSEAPAEDSPTKPDTSTLDGLDLTA